MLIQRFKETIHNLLQAISNFWWGFVMSPLLTKYSMKWLKPDFVFLVHPRFTTDLFILFPFLKIFGVSFAQWLLTHLWPVVGPKITTNNHVYGRIVFCPLTVEMIVKDIPYAQKKIQEAARTASAMGTQYIGLGALTASMTALGLFLKSTGLNITTGHTSTSILGSRQLLTALDRIGKKINNCTIAIVGIGSIGSAVASQIAGYVHKIILVDIADKSARMQRLAKELKTTYGLDVDISIVEEDGYNRLYEADGVFTATSSPTSWLQSSMLNPVAIVVDDSQPLSMTKEEASKHTGLVLQVLANAPGVDCHIWFSEGVGRRYQYTCLAEVIALAQHDQGIEGVIGPVSQKSLEKITPMLTNAGFTNLVFVSYGMEITKEAWERVRTLNLELNGEPTAIGFLLPHFAN